MQQETYLRYLDDPHELGAWLSRMGIRNVERARANFVSISNSRISPDLVAIIGEQLSERLPGLSDADMALNNLDRFFSASRNPLSLATLFERDPEALTTLLQIFSNSQHLSDLLIRDPESFDLLRLTEGKPVSREVLIDEICAETAAAVDERDVMALIRRHKQRETLRIAYGDVVLRQRIQTVTEQISYLADALVEAAVRAARQRQEQQRGSPLRPDGRPARFCVLALGKLGGMELNYSSDIDLIFLCDDEGHTNGNRRITNVEFFGRMASHVIKLLTEPTAEGVAYRVDMRLRPNGGQGPLVIGSTAALHYYDMFGRTWERQAYVKARAIAGDTDLGEEFLEQLQPWIYRRYLSRADIAGIHALKRRIEKRSIREGGDERNVKTGNGGIRDIEFVIQFLQLLNGGDLPQIRTGNTLEAIDQLERTGCLTLQERNVLEENYIVLRRLEHRLQIMFDLQTHMMPSDTEELRKLAIRMGFTDGPHRSPLEAFLKDLQGKTEGNRSILNHLLSEPFGSEETPEPEVDLILDPDPPEAVIQEVLGGYGFKNISDAYQNFMALAIERISFLSTRRCRHFLAAIAPQLLREIAATPDPDSTLINLSKVSDSIGGKGVLWELFSVNPPSLRLYVRLCAATPYLSGMLTSNPGMIDELMDSLVLDKLPSTVWLERMLDDLLYGAEDITPILHGYKNSLHLRVGVRDILGKEDIRNTHRVLSDVAEVCVRMIASLEFERLVQRFGSPTIIEPGGAERPCELIILALGKLGGREPNYHSDLDVVFLYESDGVTQQPMRSRSQQTTTNQHFFSHLAQRIIKVISQMGPFGRLYEMDPRLRPTGRSGALAVSLDEFVRYFAGGQGQLWERQALCKARPIFGSAAACDATMQVVRQAIRGDGWSPESAASIQHMRGRLQDSASPTNLKRGPGGTVDIEFAVQMLQLQHAEDAPQVLVPGTLDAIDQLQAAGYLSTEDCEFLSESYRFLRSIEARLRLMNTTARHDLPENPLEQQKLAFLLGYDSSAALLEKCQSYTHRIRECFLRLFAQASGPSSLPDSPT
jgi:glutamate-ammonia-ligase adenylyltransferase